MRARHATRLPIATALAIVAMALAAPSAALFSSGPARPAPDTGSRHRAAAQRAEGAVAAPARSVDRTLLLNDVRVLSDPKFEGRAAGTPGGVAARQWLLSRFQASGLSSAGVEGFLQPFTIASRNLRAVLPGGQPFRTELSAANLVGRVAGTDPSATLIVITAHYDHLGVRNGVLYPGADDNASGVAVLLAAARHFAADVPRHSMVFAALDAEEIGLRGARALVDSPLIPRGRTALNVNVDMASRSAANEIYAAGTYHTPVLRPLLEDVQKRTTVNIRFGHDRPQAGTDGPEDWTRSSDHAAFHEAGIPFVYFGVEDHQDYHRPTDTADRIDVRFFGDVADMVVDALRTFDARLP